MIMVFSERREIQPHGIPSSVQSPKSRAVALEETGPEGVPTVSRRHPPESISLPAARMRRRECLTLPAITRSQSPRRYMTGKTR